MKDSEHEAMKREAEREQQKEALADLETKTK